MPTQYEMNRAWRVLTRRARRKRTITYGELVEEAGLPGIAQGVGREYLDLIWPHCERMGKPNITSIVVLADTGKPGSGYPGNPSLVPSEQRRVYACDWSDVPPPRVV